MLNIRTAARFVTGVGLIVALCQGVRALITVAFSGERDSRGSRPISAVVPAPMAPMATAEPAGGDINPSVDEGCWVPAGRVRELPPVFNRFSGHLDGDYVAALRLTEQAAREIEVRFDQCRERLAALEARNAEHVDDEKGSYVRVAGCAVEADKIWDEFRESISNLTGKVAADTIASKLAASSPLEGVPSGQTSYSIWIQTSEDSDDSLFVQVEYAAAGGGLMKEGLRWPTHLVRQRFGHLFPSQ